MSLKSAILHTLSVILHGEAKPTYVNVSYLQPSKQLVGKKVIITGGGKGIGYAMAKKFKSEGADVLIAGRSENRLKESAKDIGCMYLTLDVRNIEDFDTFIDNADKMLGGINCLVNNAGISLHEKGFLDVSPEQYDSQFDTNLKGPLFLTQCFINKCNERENLNTRNILFTSSETGITADERPYGLTKAALNSLVQGLAYRYVNQGYRINAIAPGVTVSDMIETKPDGDLTCNYNVTKRFYLPDEIAEVASFLLSDASNCLNGQIIVCNEGKTINARWR